MSSAPARILVVEDDSGIRNLLSAALGREGYEVEAIGDGLKAEEVHDRFQPDLAILDVRLGEGPDGFTVARRLRTRSDLALVFLTDQTEVTDRLTGFETGADDYIPKPFVLAELLARVKALLRRSGRTTSSVFEVGSLKIDEAGRQVYFNGDAVTLTRIEFELLATLARQPGRVASKNQLLTKVWGFDGYDQNLVEVHVSSLRKKLGSDAAKMVQTVRGVGYVLRP